MAQNLKTPPIILRLLNTPISALEDLLPLTPMGFGKITQTTPTDSTEASFDQFILSQYLMLLYINIFIFPQTSFIYKDVFADLLIYVKSQKNTVKDTILKDLITNYSSMEDARNWESMRTLEMAILRVKPEDAYPNLVHIIKTVVTIYSSKFSSSDVSTIIHRISLQKLDGYDSPTFVLSPLFETTIDTTRIETISSLFWKLIFSFTIETRLTAPGELTQVMNLLGLLALPLDPISLTRQMQKSMINDGKTGVPFINYLAMYLREQQLGLAYDLSPMADARRILMRRAHQFFGFGGTCISDFNFAYRFLVNLDNNSQDVLSDQDHALLNILLKGDPDAAIKFIKPVTYDAATEAAKTPVDDKKTKSKLAPKDKSTKDAFSDDPEKLDTSDNSSTDVSDDDADTSDTLNEDSLPAAKNGDDNIDRMSDVGQDSAAANAKTFIPLALPTETIDDHLLRLMVLRYVDDMDKDPTPDITPENLDILKYWCDSWLFVASIDQTKKLLTQLKLTGQLKELV